MADYAFIHIPKNAGQSIEKALKDIPEIDFFGHGVLKEKIINYKKIYILREPVDRFTSAFFYLKTYRNNPNSNFFNNPDELLQALGESDYRASHFMKIHKGYHHVNGGLIKTDWVFHPQSAWIFDPWRIMNFYKLDEEIELLNETLGIDIKISHFNKSNRTDFEYSVSSLNILKDIYKDDFELCAKHII
jgi:hypothetical protein